MADILFVTVWGGENSNSYVSFIDASSIAATILDNKNWITSSRDKKHKALLAAVWDIDHSQGYIGSQFFTRQQLSFPRSMFSSSPLRSVEISTFDQDQQNQIFYLPLAQVKQAIHRLDLLLSPPLLEAQNKGLNALSSGGGSSSVSFSLTRSGNVLSTEVKQLLGPWKAARRVLRG